MLTTQLVPQGLNVTDSNATAGGFVFVMNDVKSTTQAYVNKAGVTKFTSSKSQFDIWSKEAVKNGV